MGSFNKTTPKHIIQTADGNGLTGLDRGEDNGRWKKINGNDREGERTTIEGVCPSKIRVSKMPFLYSKRGPS
jgi:hypothetical protein